MKKAVFLDRDGVINEMVYNADFGTVDSPMNPEELVLRSGTAEAIKFFKSEGYLTVVVSNQPAIAKGKMSLRLLEDIDKKMKEELGKEGGSLDAIYYCLHHQDAKQVKVKEYLKDCDCRKPRPGLLLKAAQDLDIDLKQSFIIGDGLTDIEAGKSAGCKTIFLGSLKEYYVEEMEKRNVKPDFSIKNILEAERIIKKVKKV